MNQLLSELLVRLESIDASAKTIDTVKQLFAEYGYVNSSDDLSEFVSEQLGRSPGLAIDLAT